MLLCIDIGNTNISCGVFDDKGAIAEVCRYDTKHFGTSDQFGLFLLSFLTARSINTKAIKKITVSSVVPNANYSLTAACKKYFILDPEFLRPETNGFLKIQCFDPSSVGTDLIAGSIAATRLYPDKNLIIVGFGTATTISVISKTMEYLGTVILPGLKTEMDSLASSTALLPRVEIKKPSALVGRSTAESIQSGLFYGQKGAIKELVACIIPAYFKDESPIIIGTGGFVGLFSEEGMFTEIQPHLVLQGLYFKSMQERPSLGDGGIRQTLFHA